MNMDVYEQKMLLLDAYIKLDDAKLEVKNGKLIDAEERLKNIRKKYNV